MIHKRRSDTYKTLWYKKKLWYIQDLMIHKRRYDTYKTLWYKKRYDTYNTLWYIKDAMINERRYDTYKTLWYIKDAMIHTRPYNTWKTLWYVQDVMIHNRPSDTQGWMEVLSERKRQDCVFMNPCTLLLHSMYSNKSSKICNSSLKISFLSKVFIFR